MTISLLPLWEKVPVGQMRGRVFKEKSMKFHKGEAKKNRQIE